jgi:hypothetical protein
MKLILNNENKSGQVMLEFTFAMIVIMLMMYSMMMIFRWTGKDMADRRIAHEDALFQNVQRPWSYKVDKVYQNSPEVQLDSYFYKPIKMNAVTDVF